MCVLSVASIGLGRCPASRSRPSDWGGALRLGRVRWTGEMLYIWGSWESELGVCWPVSDTNSRKCSRGVSCRQLWCLSVHHRPFQVTSPLSLSLELPAAGPPLTARAPAPRPSSPWVWVGVSAVVSLGRLIVPWSKPRFFPHLGNRSSILNPLCLTGWIPPDTIGVTPTKDPWLRNRTEKSMRRSDCALQEGTCPHVSKGFGDHSGFGTAHGWHSPWTAQPTDGTDVFLSPGTVPGSGQVRVSVRLAFCYVYKGTSEMG